LTALFVMSHLNLHTDITSHHIITQQDVSSAICCC